MGCRLRGAVSIRGEVNEGKNLHFEKLIVIHKGLFSFSNMEEIKEAESAISADYRAHSRAAYEIACEFFEAGKVLRSLLDRAEV